MKKILTKLQIVDRITAILKNATRKNVDMKIDNVIRLLEKNKNVK